MIGGMNRPRHPSRSLEPLEPRRLLTVTNLMDGRLEIVGTSGDDELVVDRAGADLVVTLNGQQHTFTLADGINNLQFLADAGTDTVRVRDANAQSINILKAGGAIAMRYDEQNQPIIGTLANVNCGVERAGGIDSFPGARATIAGGGGDDRFDYYQDDDTAPAELHLIGNAGNDEFVDQFSGQGIATMRVTLEGGAGDDTFIIDENTLDTLLGGDGDDRVILNNGAIPNSLDLGAGSGDRVDVAGSMLELIDARAWRGVETIGGIFGHTVVGPRGGARFEVFGASTISGQNGPDRIVFMQTLIDGGDYSGGAGANTIDLSAITGDLNITLDDLANDTSPDGTFNIRPNFVRIYTGSGNDTIVGTNRAETIIGFEGDDVIFGMGGDDLLIGHFGSDAINGGDGNDTIEGSAGFDSLEAGAGDDLLIGGFNPDRLLGGPGNDTLSGGGGSDILTAGTDGDLLVGGAGNDRFFTRNNLAIDTLQGGRGTDRAQSDDDDIRFSIEVLLTE